ncbi:MAG: hypothetical protein ACI8ZM_000540 [Crocinitomix sp.]|jgi:hypothetical protein
MDMMESAREKLKQRLPIERIRQMEKYKEITEKQYGELMNKLEILAISLLDFYVKSTREL